MKTCTTITELCKANNTKHYYDDGYGLIGIPYSDHINWYRLTIAGYSLVVSSLGPRGAKLHKVEENNVAPIPN